MLERDDSRRLQEAFDWANKKSEKCAKRTFVFSSEDSACEAAKTLGMADVRAECQRSAVTITRPHDPDTARRVREIWDLNKSVPRQGR